MRGKSRRWGVAAVSAALGATAGGLVWFTQTKPPPPGSVLLDNGLRSPMAMIAVGPQPWIYLLGAIFGVLLATGIALAAFLVADGAAADRP